MVGTPLSPQSVSTATSPTSSSPNRSARPNHGSISRTTRKGVRRTRRTHLSAMEALRMVQSSVPLPTTVGRRPGIAIARATDLLRTPSIVQGPVQLRRSLHFKSSEGNFPLPRAGRLWLRRFAKTMLLSCLERRDQAKPLVRPPLSCARIWHV